MAIASPAIAKGITRFIVLDTETTGVTQWEKIVTIAALCFENNRIIQRSLYLCFDPRKNSSPEAEKVHGWDNWTTRFQDLFEDHANDVRSFLEWGDTLVMHNARYDMHYVQREFRKAGHAPIDVPQFCTLEHARTVWQGQGNKLDDCVGRIGLPRRPGRHNALQDAFYTAALHLHFQGERFYVPEVERWPMPRNYREPDPRPEGDLPRRTKKKPRGG
ncbi:3'-5' exonuclease [Pelagibacterium sp. 26DY04]|uniref:3'-5' exonuclease n=1 Tax=Pelagibacterium sp. 26DY04 TaxID=2967130 RepID=UPI002814D27B|nr:3'-5' exonuclease [Pelagibacterium sp. 26DY04]WMT88653.1 3'-5' exonuclease [Pelagibacterium sp. 26DY04]